MREIKFRAWDTFNKLMWGTDECYIDNLSKFFVEYDAALYGENEPVLMQYTGLKDKNEKEIYEGDVCKNTYKPMGCKSWNEWSHHVVISFSNKGVGTKVVREILEVNNLPEDLKDNHFSNHTYNRILKNRPVINSTIGVGGERWEIIGNIYENPELIKQ